MLTVKNKEALAAIVGARPDSLTFLKDEARKGCRFLEWRGEIVHQYIVITYLNKKLFVGIADRELTADINGVHIADGTKPRYDIKEILDFLQWKKPKKYLEFDVY